VSQIRRHGVEVTVGALGTRAAGCAAADPQASINWDAAGLAVAERK
jgi:hypothetical protein